jgi:uncharacterized protein YggE
MHYHLPRILLIIFMILAPLPLLASEGETPATIEVTGRGSVSERPDRAVLSFGIETNATDANEAIRLNASQADELIAVLRKKMGTDDKIVTSQFQLHPVYSQKARISPSSYRVTNSVRLETTQVDNLGPFIDAAVKAGSGRIGQLRFSHSKSDELARKATALAVEDARRAAEDMARAAGVKITRLHRLRSATAHVPRPMHADMTMAARAATPIEVGELTIERQVTAIFLIE